MAKEIPLTKGLFAIVDDEDFERLARFKWQAGRIDYPYSYRYDNELGGSVFMHREVLGVMPGLLVDRKQNPNTISGFKGVYRMTRSPHRWQAKIRYMGKNINLGSFGDKIEAAKAYNAAAPLYFGEFARLNAIPDEAS